MKRINAILLTVLLLGMLTACDQNVGRHADGIIKADKATFEIGKTHSSFEGRLQMQFGMMKKSNSTSTGLTKQDMTSCTAHHTI